MINKPLPFEDLNIRIPIVIPIKGRVINHGSGLVHSLDPPRLQALGPPT